MTRFAGYPSALVYAEPGGKKKKGKRPVQHLLWGDWLRLKGETRGDFERVRARGVDGWMHKSEIQKERLLEVVFVDIGQGDGCLLVTPDDKHIVIDAGEGDNMVRFLNWRYGGFDKPWTFDCGIISHPDRDHYGGFDPLFDEPNVKFRSFYHSGIVERKTKKSSDSLGPKSKSGRFSYLTKLTRTKKELEELLSKSKNWKGKIYPTMLRKALDNGKFSNIQMLSILDEYMPGYGTDQDLSIQVLGPVVEPDKNGTPRLRWLQSVGKTKNGHSVVLRAQYRNVSLLLGGDLNIPSENLLLTHHTGVNSPPKSEDDRWALIEAARLVFQVDIAKTCHHGSSDFSPHFLDATNPIASVISSGDNEPHSHPRADALGSIGLHSRGTRPLIFSTELARSAKESIKHPFMLRREIEQLSKQIDDAPTGTKSEIRKKERLHKKLTTLLEKKLNRSIAVFGAINVRTDGHKVVLAQKLEQSSKSRKWDIYRLEPQGNGPLQYVSKH